MHSPKKLDGRQEKFCHEYMLTNNAQDAAIRAGYSYRGAKTTGYRLLQQPVIQNYLNELQQALRDKFEVTREKLVHELAIIAFADISDFYRDDNTLKDFHEIDPQKRRAIAAMRFTRHTTKNSSHTTITFKLHDKINAMLQLGKHLGFYKEEYPRYIKRIVFESAHPKKQMDEPLQDGDK